MWKEPPGTERSERPKNKAWEHGDTTWDTPVPWLCLHWSVQASRRRREAVRWCIKAFHQLVLPSTTAYVCDHVWYLSDADVKVLVVYGTGDGLRPVELGLLHCKSCRLVPIRVAGHLRWSLQPFWQMYCPRLKSLSRLKEIISNSNNIWTVATLYSYSLHRTQETDFFFKHCNVTKPECSVTFQADLWKTFLLNVVQDFLPRSKRNS